MNIAGFGNNGTGNANGSGNGGDSFFRRVGTGTYVMVFLSIIGSLLLSEYLISIVALIVNNYQLWRCVTFPFSSPGLIPFLFQLLFLYFWAFPFEQERGTLNLFARTLTLAAYTSLFDVVFYLLLRLVWPAQAFRLFAYGFFRLFFVDMCAHCFADPFRSSGFCGFPVSFPQIYLIPLFLLMDLLLNNLYLGNVPCVLAGFVMYRWLGNLDRFLISAAAAKNTEKCLLCLDGAGTFYSINNKTALRSQVANEATRTFTMPESAVGGRTLSDSQRRNEWVQKFGADTPATPAQKDPEIGASALATAPGQSVVRPNNPDL